MQTEELPAELDLVRTSIDEGFVIYEKLGEHFVDQNVTAVAVALALSKLYLDKVAPGLVEKLEVALKENRIEIEKAE